MIVLAVLCGAGCQEDFLEVRSNKDQFTPTTLNDFQNILDNPEVFAQNNTPGAILNAADDFYVTDAGFSGLSVRDRSAYLWSAGADETNNYWAPLYRQVFYSNVVLDGLDQMKEGKSTELWKTLRGTALFYRSYAYYTLALMFTRPYTMDMAGTDPGVPLRLVADAGKNYPRGTVEQVNRQVISDLQEAAGLLPGRTGYKTRPGRTAALALLARASLAAAAYGEAEKYAGQALELNHTLLEYGTIDSLPRRPFPLCLPDSNEEVIWYASASSTFARAAQTFADSALYGSYQPGDRRRSLYFLPSGAGRAGFKGSYTGDNYFFTGLATDEMYLIKAECLARRGAVAEALEALNTLLSSRWDRSLFRPLAASGAEETLALVLAERRKELIGRGTRWADLRRLNQDPHFKVTLVRELQGQRYELRPEESGRYVFPIPQAEVTQFGLAQN